MQEKNADIAVIKNKIEVISSDVNKIKDLVFNGGCAALKTLKESVKRHDKEIDEMHKQIWKNVGMIAAIQTIVMAVFMTFLKIFGN